MKNRKSIAIDMDGVLANNGQQYLTCYYEETGILLHEKEIFGKQELICLPDVNAVSRYLNTPGFFRSLPVSAGAKDVVTRLCNDFEVYIVSAAMEYPRGLTEKYEWLEEHFPCITWKQIVFCGDKRVIGTDYLIDDHHKNLSNFRGKSLLFEAFHNIHESQFMRLKNWADVGQYFNLSDN